MPTKKRGDEPAKNGRPTKYDPRFDEIAQNLALLGLNEERIAEVFSVAITTLQAWKKQHASFREALMDGKVMADAKVARGLFKRATGYEYPDTVITSYQGEVQRTRVMRHLPPDVGAASLWLSNRQPATWRRNPDPMDGEDEPTPQKFTIEVVDARKPAASVPPESASTPAGG